MRRPRGIALILALLVLTLLVVVVTQLAYSTKVDLQVARNARDGQAGLYAAWSGVEAAKGLLRDDLGRNAHDGPADRWARLKKPLKIGEQEVTVRIEDEDRKLNLLLLASPHQAYRDFAKGTLERLLALCREGTEDAEEHPPETLARDLAEWIAAGKSPGILDPDSPGGKKEDAKVPALSLGDFLLVPGWTETILWGPPPKPKPLGGADEGLAPPEEEDPTSDPSLDELLGKKEKTVKGVGQFLTLFSRGRFNLNTVDALVLKAAGGTISDAAVQAVVSKRSATAGAAAPAGSDPSSSSSAPTDTGPLTDNAFTKVDEVKDLSGWADPGPTGTIFDTLKPYLTVTSRTFKVTATAKVGRVERTVEVVLEREPKDFRVLWYKER